MSLVTVEKDQAVAVVSINRPKALNALNTNVIEELAAVLAELEADAETAAVVLTGAGDKAFVAGADIAEMASYTPKEALRFARLGQQVFLSIEKMQKPVIAAVNGFALGGGMELAMACDFIYASEKAKFGQPEVTLGIIPGFGGSQNLARLIGAGRAAELVLSGKMLPADKALQWGLVNEVVPADELLDAAREIAGKIAANGALAVSAAKDALVNGLNMNKEDGFRYESTLFANLFASEDQKEGMEAFLGKRKPAFKGN